MALQSKLPEFRHIVILLFCVSSVLYFHAFGGPLGQIPGPLDARFSRLWMIKKSWQGDMHRTMIELHRKHGKLVRTGPNEVSVIDLSAIKRIYTAGTQFSKSSWYGVFQGHRKFDLFADLSVLDALPERLHMKLNVQNVMRRSMVPSAD